MRKTQDRGYNMASEQIVSTFQKLTLNAKILQDKKNSLKKETEEALVSGRKPTREFRALLDGLEQIEQKVMDLQKSQMKKPVLAVFITMEEFDHVMSRLENIEKYSESSPFDHGPGIPSIDSPHRTIRQPSMPRPVEEVQKVKPHKKAEREVTQEAEVTNSKATIKFTKSKGMMKPFLRRTAEIDPVAGVKGNVTTVVPESYKVKSEMGTSSETKSLPVPDLSRASSSTKAEAVWEMLPLQSSEVSRDHESETGMRPSASRGEASIHELRKEIVIVPGTTVKSTLAVFNNRFDLTKEATEKPRLVPILKDRVDIVPADGRQIATDEAEGCTKSPNSRKSGNRSIQNILQKIIGSIQDDNAKRIGIYGRDGIGKTAVLKALVGNQGVKGMFDIIVWVTVSRCWSRRKIQNEILRQIGLRQEDFEADTDDEIASKLLLTLEKGKYLLLLDDIWQRIDLDAVGFPGPGQEHGCIFVMTTRSLEVCRGMDAKEIEVCGLPGKEAWDLFHEQVGQIIDYQEVKPYAQALVNECGGVPLNIIVTGSALHGEKDVQVWRHALKEFLLPKTLGMNYIESQIQHLKFSYERLKVHGTKNHRLRACDIQTCFLYCALFAEGYAVSKSKLVECWIQEDLLTGNLVDAQKKGHDIIDVLIHGVLLENSDDGLSIKMHDTIRDLATMVLSTKAEDCQLLVRTYPRWTQLQTHGNNLFSEPIQIQNKEAREGHQYLYRAGTGLTEPPIGKEWELAKMIFLMDNDLSSLPERPDCPLLSTLFLQRNYRLRVVPVSFFDFMPFLKVLDMSKTRITSLPESLSHLVSLEKLILRDCELLTRLPSGLKELKHLQLLDLHGTAVYQLPEEIGELGSLWHLEVSFYGPVDHEEYSLLPFILIADGIISRLCFLTNLSIVVYPGDLRWKRNAESIIKEICNLNYLIALRFYFPKVEHLQLFLRSSPSWKGNRLKKFNFIVGHDVKRMVSRVPQDVELDYNQQNQCLRFVNDQRVPDAVVQVLVHTTALYLDHHLVICSLSEFGVRIINGLEFCVVRECPEIEVITDSKELTLPFLEYLSLHYLEKLEGIWKNPMPAGSFASLKHLCIRACPKLSVVVASSTCHYIYNLVELFVEDCQGVTEIISDDSNVKRGDILLPKLKRLTLRHLPKLVSIWKGAWPSLEYRSIYNCPGLEEPPYSNRKITA